MNLNSSNEPPNAAPELKGVQLSVLELFVLMTAIALGIWLYNRVHPFVASALGACVLFVAIVRLIGRRNVVIGGLFGFVIAMPLSFLVCLLSGLDFTMNCLVMLLGPCAGYVLGGCITEFSEDDSL